MTIKKDEIEVAIDLGTSLSKGLYSVNGLALKYLVMGAQCLKLPKTSKKYLPKKQQTGLPEDNAWIFSGEKLVLIGRMAREYRGGTKIKPLKAQLAIPKIMAIIGAIVQKEKLGNDIDLNLGILLPYSEITSKNDLIVNLKEQLLNFEFQGSPLSVRLNLWEVKPEGGGLAMLRYFKNENRFNGITQIYLMLGHRNTTLLVFRKGSFSPIHSGTTNHGFYDCIDKFREKLPGVERESVLEAINFQGSVIHDWNKRMYTFINRKVGVDFSQIIRSSESAKIQEANTAFFESLEEYWTLISDWLDELLPVMKSIDEFCICGGASVFLMSHLQKKLGQVKISELENERNELWQALGYDDHSYPQEFIEQNLTERMLDVWGMYAIFTNYFEKQGEVA